MSLRERNGLVKVGESVLIAKRSLPPFPPLLVVNIPAVVDRLLFNRPGWREATLQVVTLHMRVLPQAYGAL